MEWTLAGLEVRIKKLEEDSHPKEPVIPAMENIQMITDLSAQVLGLQRRICELEDFLRG